MIVRLRAVERALEGVVSDRAVNVGVASSAANMPPLTYATRFGLGSPLALLTIEPPTFRSSRKSLGRMAI